MKESELRKWHRNFGIFLVLFIIIQAGSGLLISLKHHFSFVTFDKLTAGVHVITFLPSKKGKLKR